MKKENRGNRDDCYNTDYPHDKSYCLFRKYLIEMVNDQRVDIM